MVAALGLADYFTGRDLVISAFYLLPICWVTWVAGRQSGLALSLASTGVWLAGDYLSGYGYAHPVIPLWNAIMLLLMFLASVYVLTAFQKAHFHLEETVAVRTEALHLEMEERKRAEAAKIQAERLAMAGMMAAQVAHEVRNPLGAITLTLDLLDEELAKLRAAGGKTVEEGIECVSEMRGEVQRINRVIEDYLVLARPRTAHLAVTDLNQLITKKLAFMNGVFDTARISLSLRLTSMPVIVNADADQFWQALLNLIRNSIEAMPEGGTLTVLTAVNHDSAIVSLADTGCGMTPAQKEKLYVPFATSKADGTGLGLALVQQIVVEHRGRIDCQSEPGNGTTFTITIPLHTKPAPKDAAAGTRHPAPLAA